MLRFQPIRRKSKARKRFPASNTSDCSAFLMGSFDDVNCDWLRFLLWFSFTKHKLKPLYKPKSFKAKAILSNEK